MYKYLLLISGLIASTSLHAQDYVITQKNDTLIGQVFISGYDIYDRIEVKAEKKTNLTIFNVKLASINKEIYKPVKGSDGVRMMRLVRSGYLSQYVGRAKETNVYEIPYLVKLDGSATEIPNVSFRKYIISFLSDCETIKQKIENADLNKKDIDKIVDLYNACINDQTKAVTTKENTAPVNNSTTSALTSLQAKIEKDSALPTQKDALDILKDILGKVNEKQTVPNYLVEGLKSLLKDAPDYQKDLENVVAQLKNQ